MLVIKDFATTILASALTAAATSVVVSDASRLPALSAGDYYYLVLQKFTDRTNVEVVKVTGAAGNTLTVVRAQAGTTAKSFAIGDYAEQRVTVGTFSEYIAQSVAGKVDKSDGYVEQSLGLLNTGDLVKATVGISYDAVNGHGTILSGGEGANKVTPYVALRPLGVADGSVQMKYAQDGSLILSGGSRYVETGLLSMKHPTDANGWPNAINSDANNYNNRARGKVQVNNNALYFIADAALNARRFGIQSGHESTAYATAYGILDLNPFGGTVRVNGGTVYHTNYVPTPAAVGAVAKTGGTMTGALILTRDANAITLNPASGTASYILAQQGGVASWHIGKGSVSNDNITLHSYALSTTLTLTGTNVVSSRIVSAPDYSVTSDVRLKSNFEKIENPLEKVSKLEGLVYDKKSKFNSDITREGGLIAQAVRDVMPEAVREDDDGYLSISTSSIIALLLESIKELKTEVDARKKENLKGCA